MFTSGLECPRFRRILRLSMGLMRKYITSQAQAPPLDLVIKHCPVMPSAFAAADTLASVRASGPGRQARCPLERVPQPPDSGASRVSLVRRSCRSPGGNQVIATDCQHGPRSYLLPGARATAAAGTRNENIIATRGQPVCHPNRAVHELSTAHFSPR